MAPRGKGTSLKEGGVSGGLREQAGQRPARAASQHGKRTDLDLV